MSPFEPAAAEVVIVLVEHVDVVSPAAFVPAEQTVVVIVVGVAAVAGADCALGARVVK